MPDYLLFLRLAANTFILDKKSLHYPGKKRVLFVLFVSPVLLLIILLNQLFLLLDNILFLPYRWKKIDKSAFIVGVPRSATSYMFELMSFDERFTCFKLWEIIFAPSIIQKYLVVALKKVDRITGRPLTALSRWIDERWIGDFRHIHSLGISLPEEDEPLMIYDFSSLYLYYFFPEAKAIKPYLFFDDAIPFKKRKRIMNYYYRCVQRHQFVFNPGGDKIFLSKNPAFVSKINSLVNRFHQCKIIYMLRSPLETIPSTISLNEHIFQLFSKVVENPERNMEARDIILKWYRMSRKALEEVPDNQKYMVYFKNIVSHPAQELKAVYRLVGLNPSLTPSHEQGALIEEKKNYRSLHQYDPQAGLVDSDEAYLMNELKLATFRDYI